MSTRLRIFVALVIAAMSAGGCGTQAQEQRAAPNEKAQTAAPVAGTTGAPPKIDAPPEKDKQEKRANTPPGKSRAGEGPAEGAIVDPAGVTKK